MFSELIIILLIILILILLGIIIFLLNLVNDKIKELENGIICVKAVDNVEITGISKHTLT